MLLQTGVFVPVYQQLIVQECAHAYRHPIKFRQAHSSAALKAKDLIQLEMDVPVP